jgi:hypothetical protein
VKMCGGERRKLRAADLLALINEGPFPTHAPLNS